MNLVKLGDVITSLLAFIITSFIAIVISTTISALFVSSKYKTYGERFYGRLPAMSFLGVAWAFLASCASGYWRNFSVDGIYFLIIGVIIYAILVYRFTYWLTHEKNHKNDDSTTVNSKIKHEESSNNFSRLVAERYTQDAISDKSKGAKAKRATKISKTGSNDTDYASLAESIFELSVEFMRKYSSLLNSIDPAIDSMSYLLDTTSAGTSLYVYAMVKTRNQLEKEYTSKAEFERQDTKMIHIFADKLMESPVSLMKKMSFTADDMSSYIDMMKDMGSIEYINTVNKIIDKAF